MTTLIFPASGPSAVEYLESARRRDETVIAASSVYDAGMEAEFGELILLPYVHDGTFRERFTALVHSRKVTQVYSAVASVYAFLKDFFEKEKLPVRLMGSSPITQQVEAYRKLFRKAREAQPFIECCADAPEALSLLDIAAVFRQAALIYGESSEEKIAAMTAIFATAPRGDVVEIGTLLGKSVFVLHYLARHYGIGSVLSVDPLAPEPAVQHDSPEIARALVDAWDFSIMHESFIVNLLPMAGGRFNYLRMESEHGFRIYENRRVIGTPHFGEVPYTGEIAVIHIDGNHDYRQVSRDCELWLKRLAPGAWLILDDYLWAHGDGPRRVGDALLESRRQDIERAFVCGKALFVRFR